MSREAQPVGPTLAAIIATLVVCTDQAAAQTRNCPIVADQLVLVDQAGPTAIRLDVANLGDGDVSIFQFPLGGILQQTGPTPLDFVFVPEEDFNGTTDFTYRVTPPFGCPRSVQLGHVTIAGGTATGTAAGLAPPVCGIGLFTPAVMLLTFAAISRRRIAQRRFPG